MCFDLGGADPCNPDFECAGTPIEGCTLETKISLDVLPGSKPDENCFACGEKVYVEVNMATGTSVVTGGQFLITYDPDCVEFQGCPPDSGVTLGPFFNLLIFCDDSVSGEVFFAVGRFPGPGTAGPATFATLAFTKLCECGDCNFDFVMDQNPKHTILSNDEGQPVPTTENESKTIRLAGELELTGPGDVEVNPDCDMATAIVTWDPVTASDSCDGDDDPPVITCVNGHSEDVDIDHLAESGGEFPQGVSTFCCTATNSCGNADEHCWTVTVSDQHSMDVVVQLSPPIVGNPIDRCITFEFFSNCVEDPTVFCDTCTFGFPYDFRGHCSPKLKVPKGQFACITARDCLHTLRAVSDIDCVDNQLVAEFKGDPFFGGNWLIGGNVHDLCWKQESGTGDVIDILDFGTFVSQYLDQLDPNTPCDPLIHDGIPCETNDDCVTFPSGEDVGPCEDGVCQKSGTVKCNNDAGPHSDVNGDGVVDGSDYSFIAANFLEESKAACCDPPGGPASVGLVSITVKELRARGLGELATADLNGDGVLDQNDMVAFSQGKVPARGAKNGRNAGERASLGSN
jgi:hypothetical protein